MLFCTKIYDLEQTARQLSFVIHENTVIIPLLNGVNICERLKKEIHKGTIIPACVYIAGKIESDDVVVQSGPAGAIVGGKPGFAAAELLQIMHDSHIQFKWTVDPYSGIWEKYLLVASFALVTAKTEKSFDGVLNDAIAKKDLISIMYEIKQLAAVQQIYLPDDVIEKTLHRASKLLPGTKTSYLRDIETRGAMNEGEICADTILSLSRKYGVTSAVVARYAKDIQKKLAHLEP